MEHKKAKVHEIVQNDDKANPETKVKVLGIIWDPERDTLGLSES